MAVSKGNITASNHNSPEADIHLHPDHIVVVDTEVDLVAAEAEAIAAEADIAAEAEVVATEAEAVTADANKSQQTL